MERDVWFGGRKVGAVAEPSRLVFGAGKLVITCAKCRLDIECERCGVGDYVGPARCPGCAADLLAGAAF